MHGPRSAHRRSSQPSWRPNGRNGPRSSTPPASRPSESHGMALQEASRSMVRTAVLRAAHQLFDSPVILSDPIAVDLVPESSRHAILATPHDARTREAPLRSLFALRSRFAEDRLAEAAARHVRQYVIVG